jgi:hypothetical protein
MAAFTRLFAVVVYTVLALVALSYCLGLTAALGITSPTPF